MKLIKCILYVYVSTVKALFPSNVALVLFAHFFATKRHPSTKISSIFYQLGPRGEMCLCMYVETTVELNNIMMALMFKPSKEPIVIGKYVSRIKIVKDSIILSEKN